MNSHLRSVWDLMTGELKRTLTGHTDWVTSVCVTDKHIISGSADNTVRLVEALCMLLSWH